MPRSKNKRTTRRGQRRKENLIKSERVPNPTRYAGPNILTIPGGTPEGHPCPNGHPEQLDAYLTKGTEPTQCPKCGEVPVFETDDGGARSQTMNIAMDADTGAVWDGSRTPDDPCPHGHVNQAEQLLLHNAEPQKCQRCGETPTFRPHDDPPALLEERPDGRIHLHTLMPH